jgi:hypothetical protein
LTPGLTCGTVTAMSDDEKAAARLLGRKGGLARAAGMDAATRSALSRLAAARRWSGTTKAQRRAATAAAIAAHRANARARKKKKG